MKNCVTTYLNYSMKFLSLKKKKTRTKNFEFCHVGLTKKRKRKKKRSNLFKYYLKKKQKAIILLEYSPLVPYHALYLDLVANPWFPNLSFGGRLFSSRSLSLSLISLLGLKN